jgi:hypothetical protein
MARSGWKSLGRIAALGVVLGGSAAGMGEMLAAEPAAAPRCPDGQVYWEPGDGCVTLPVLRKRVEPDLVSTDPGAGAEFLVRALVRRDGKVGKADVLAILPVDAVIDAGTTRAVTDAVQKWEFVPGKDTRGAPAEMYLSLRIKLLFED